MAFNDLKPILTKIDSLYNEIRRSLKISLWKVNQFTTVKNKNTNTDNTHSKLSKFLWLL